MTGENKSAYVAGSTLAKLSVPRSRTWVSRERLFARLDALLHLPLVWISAPAGSGKTILAASFLQEHGVPALWYNLDAGDGDPASFFYYLRLAAQDLSGNPDLALPAFSPEYLPGFQVFAARFFRGLYSSFPAGLVLVLDNVQEVEGHDDFLLLLKLAVYEAPAGISLLCLSRSDPPAELSRLEINGEVGRLGREDLRWNMAEAESLAQVLAPLEVTAATLATVTARSEGWGAGLVLLLRNIAKEGQPAGNPELGNDQTLFNYCAGEILAGLSRREREFLLKTASLPTVSAKLGAALTGEAEAAAILENLVEKNYFTVKLQTAEASYRYHPLFREFLLHQARRTLSPTQLAGIQGQAARLLRESGDGEAAVPLLIAAAEWPELVSVIFEIAPGLIANGRHQLLLDWFGAISAPVLEGSPWLLYWQAEALLPVDFAASHQGFARAFEMFLEQGEAQGGAMSWAGGVETIVHSLSHTARLDEWRDKLAILRSRTDLDRHPELLRYLAPQQIVIYALRSQIDNQIENWVGLTQDLLNQSGLPSQQLMAAFYLLTYFQWSGQPARSKAILELQELIVSREEVTPLYQIVTKLCRAWLSWIYGQYEQCRTAIEEGLALAEANGVHHWTYLLLVQGLANAKMHSKVTEAEGFLERLAPLASLAREMDRVYYHNESGWLEILKGRPEQALHHQQAALEIAESFGAPFVIAEACFGLSQAYQAVGESGLAERYLARTRLEGSKYGSQILAFQCDLVEVYYLLEQGAMDEASLLLARTFAQARLHGYSGFAWWRQEVVGRVCNFALERGIEPEFARNLIRQFAVPPPAAATGNEAWPWPVRIKTLGGFVLTVNEESVTFDRKAQKKPLELLKAVIALGGREVAVERLQEALWPEADGDLAQQSFKAAIHRLRKLVGLQSVTLQDGRVSLARENCWVDLWAFETVVGDLEHEKLSPAGLRLAAAKLRKLYSGDFLAGDGTAVWLIAPREHQRARFLATLERLGEALLRAGEVDTARDCYEHGLVIDPLVEQFYQGLMRCYWQLERPAEVLATLSRCRQVLAATLGLNCSPATEALALRP